MTEQTRHKLAREAIDHEIAHARAGRNHPSVRVVTLERVLAIADAKTEALKAIHRICNRLLDDNELTDLDIPLLVAALGRELDAERAVSKALAEALRTCREYVEHDGCVTIADNALAQYAASFPEKEINLEPR